MQALEALGRPVASGEPTTIAFIGPTGGWDLWQREGHRLHLQFAPDDGPLVLVTLMRPAGPRT